MELVIYLNNDQDLLVLEPLLKRLKLRFEKKRHLAEIPSKGQDLLEQQKIESAKSKLLKMHQEGVDSSYYGDPSQWQRETRTDAALPFRA